MAQGPILLSSEAEIAAVAAELSKAPTVAFDTEFVRESTLFPIVEVLQVATRDQVWLIDAKAMKGGKSHGAKAGYSPVFEPLRAVFENTSILKVAHAAQADQECLATSFGFVAKPCVDTAIMASLLGMGDGLGLGKLLKQVLGIEIKKGHARTDWSARPLPAHLLEYAEEDVRSLVELGEKLLAELEREGRREWAMKLSAKFEDLKLYDPTAEEIAERLGRGGRVEARNFGVLLELVRWREDRVKSLNLPRKWIAEDSVLMDLAQVQPKSLGHLESFRGINRGEIKNSGKRIIEAIERGKALKDVTAPKREPRMDTPGIEEARAIDLLQCYVGILADEHRVAARHLLTSAQLYPLLKAVRRDNAISVEKLVQQSLLSEDAARIAGEELIALLQGRRALGIHCQGGLGVNVVEVK